MAGERCPSVDISEFLQAADEFHGRVARGHARIEITRGGCDDVCILVSKADLESLERALEILSQTDDFRSMCRTLTLLAGQGGQATSAQSA